MADHKAEFRMQSFYLSVKSDDPKVIEQAAQTVGRIVGSIVGEALAPIAAAVDPPKPKSRKRLPKPEAKQ